MVGSRLPEPVLCVALEAVEKIQGGEEAAGALWSVFSRVKDAVEHGHRLENMSWRLWHCARVAPKIQLARSFSGGLPRYPELLPRPLSSPSLSLSSSSDGTAASIDWDRDTAVGEDDDALGSGARRNTAVSPYLQKARLHLSSGPEALAGLPRSHQLDSTLDDTVTSRDLPSVSSDSSTPHHPPQASSDAGSDVSYERGQGISLSESRDHCANNPPHVAGLKGASSLHESKSPRPVTAQASASLATYPIRHSAPSDDYNHHSRFTAEVLAAKATASSMPITLSTLHTISVGRIIADLFPEKKLGNAPCTMGTESRLQSRGTLASREGQGRLPAPAEQVVVTPQIVEPQPSTPAAGRNLSTWFGNTSSSASGTTSTTSTPRQAFPTVVVVNPTPHPTPPATPSPSVADTCYGLKPTATPFDRPEAKPEGWSSASNGQLATPVSMNGDPRSLSPNEPMFINVEPKAQDLHLLNFNHGDVTVFPLQTSLLPAAAITLPERPNETPTTHLLTPSSNPHSEMSSKQTPSAPIPAGEDKKFYLASRSGHESSESPDSLGGGSLSPQKPVPLTGKSGLSHLQNVLTHEDEVASSYSSGSHCGRSAASSTAKPKGRPGFNATGARRRQSSKRITMAAKQSIRKDAEQGDDVESKLKVEEQTKSKGKERAVGERSEDSKSPSTSVERPVSPVKSQQKLPPRPTQPSQNLRQLPTNPPRQQTQPPLRRPSSDTGTRSTASQASTVRQPPARTQLPLLPLGHLPTVPPRPRRTLELAETSSEYDTDSEEEWTSDEGGEGEDRSLTAHVSGDGKSQASGNVTSRTRDEKEFMRDADREAQRQRELFQKLPSRSYSHLGQLPRTKSGLSLLFRPDPQTFPEGHPYRTSHNSRDILARNWSAPGLPPHAMMAMTQRGTTAGPMAATVNAEPVMQSVNARRSSQGSSSNRANGLRGGYQRRGPPEDQEQETDSGEDDPENAVQASSSVAQRRLAAIMGQRTTKPQRPAPTRAVSHPTPPPEPSGAQPPAVARTTTAPVLMNPYLIDPVPLQTPHTIRRNIIQEELDEELRRNLLWERLQNQVVIRPPRAAGSILPGPWRALTPLKPEETRETQSAASDKGPGKRTFATQRTKSWAGDFHAEGW